MNRDTISVRDKKEENSKQLTPDLERNERVYLDEFWEDRDAGKKYARYKDGPVGKPSKGWVKYYEGGQEHFLKPEDDGSHDHLDFS